VIDYSAGMRSGKSERLMPEQAAVSEPAPTSIVPAASVSLVLTALKKAVRQRRVETEARVPRASYVNRKEDF
jgi:hypothetical protein